MSISKTSVLQHALRLLQEAPLMSPEDNRPVARMLRDSYDTTVTQMLRSSLWNWATRRKLLNPSAEPPAFGWAAAYPLPPDQVISYPVTTDGSLDGDLISHAVEGKEILCNETGALRLTYVAAITEDYWPGDFASAVAYALAAGICTSVTSKVTLTDMLATGAQKALQQARLNDATQDRQRFKNPILSMAYTRIYSGEQATVSDAGSIAYDLKLQYAMVLRECLEIHPWNWATQRAILTALPDTRPAFGFRYAYAKPPGLLRISQPTLDGVWQAPNITYRIEGDLILTDVGPRLPLVWVGDGSDVTLMPPTFVAYVSSELVTRVVSGDARAKLYQIHMAERERALERARMADSVQGTLESPQADAWIDARQGYDAGSDSGRRFWDGYASNQGGGNW